MGAFLTGTEVHDLLLQATTLTHELDGAAEFAAGRPYRADRFRRTRVFEPDPDRESDAATGAVRP